jgi:hypothetical protein
MTEYTSIDFHDGAPDTSGNSKRTRIMAGPTMRLYRDVQADPGTVVLEDTVRNKTYEYPWSTVKVAKRKPLATVRALDPSPTRPAERGR